MKLVGIAGSLVGEKTSQVVHDVLRVAKRIDKQIEIALIDLKEYDVEFVNGSPLAYY
ncbi:MAG: NADH-dependent FMN reductase, partial [Virgibacillus sp.]|nr:NADH-dependent FMN reductase [Virgibacillus sp.]